MPNEGVKVAVITANLGGFEKSIKQPEQSVACDFFHFTDKNFPPRFKAMTPRLQARIPKMFGWQMVPGYDYYIWVDSSCAFTGPDSVQWFLDQCRGVDIAVFKHNRRGTVQEEADYLKHRLAINCPYVTPRYENELIDEQLAEVDPQARLFASTAFTYKDSPRGRRAMKEWWYFVSRYHSIDQLGLPYAIRNLQVNVIEEDYLKCKYLEYVRNK